jgi:hypothetical protein
MMATMLPAIMLAASLTLTLVPATAFAQEVQRDIQQNEGGAWSIIVDPKVQPSVGIDANIGVNTHVITDPEDCDEASDEESQETNLGSTQEARSDGNVGDNSVYVSPQLQTNTQIGLNLYVDTDIVPAGCDPSDTLGQANNQDATQNAGGEVEAGEGSTIVMPVIQRSDNIERNQNVNTDATIPNLFQ